MVGLAIATMILAMLAHHLGLSEAVADVTNKILGCGKCLSFWSVLTVLVLSGYGILIAMALAVVMAYLSHWFGLILIGLNKFYDRLWKRTRRK